MSSFEETTIRALKLFDDEKLMEYIEHNLNVSNKNIKKSLEMTKEIDKLAQRRNEYYKVGLLFQAMAKRAISELTERKGI